jgi:hypothetical protein
MPGFLQSLGTIFARPSRRREYNFDPVHRSLFNPNPSGTPCDPAPPGLGPRFVVGGRPIAPYVRKRSERLSFSLAEMPQLAIDVDQASVSVVGTGAGAYDVRFCAQAGGASDDDARRILEKITMTRAGHSLKVRTPQYTRERPASAWLHIEAPHDRDVTVNGAYSYLEVFGIEAPVRALTTHARMKLLDVTGGVRATSRTGIIDFAGDRGQVQLEADGEIGEINLMLRAPRFEGTLDAKAEVAIRVLVPPAWESPFEAVVGRPELFVCRAGIGPQVRRQYRDGRVVFAYGPGAPVVRLVSHGALVIDSTSAVE